SPELEMPGRPTSDTPQRVRCCVCVNKPGISTRASVQPLIPNPALLDHSPIVLIVIIGKSCSQSLIERKFSQVPSPQMGAQALPERGISERVPMDRKSTPKMIFIPGGTFRMGSDKHYPEEAPVHRVTISGFWIDQTPVTKRQFKEFVRATGHVTFAEIPPPDCCTAAERGVSVCQH